jgi:hypothetical protein
MKELYLIWLAIVHLLCAAVFLAVATRAPLTDEMD